MNTRNSQPVRMTASEFLARSKRNPRQSAVMLRKRQWAITSEPIDGDQFWELFETMVDDNGNIDLSAIQPPQTQGPIEPTFFGPAMVDAAVKMVGIWMIAAGAGYTLGVAIGEALDEPDTEPSDGDGSDGSDDSDGDGDGTGDEGGGSDGAGTRSAHIVIKPYQGAMNVEMVAESTKPTSKKRATGPQVLSFNEALAALKKDRVGTLKRWHAKPGTSIVSPTFDVEAFDDLLDTLVKPDGTIDLSGLGSSTPAGVASLGPLAWAVIVVAGGAAVAFAGGVVVGLVVETIGDAEPADGGDGGSQDDNDDGDSGDTGDSGDSGDTGSGGDSGSRSVTGIVTRGPGNTVEVRGRRTERVAAAVGRRGQTV